MKKRLPLFVFSMKNVLGKRLLSETDQTKTSDGQPILKTKRYDCYKDWSGITIMLTKENINTMKNKQKLDLQWNVRFYLGDGKSDSEIVKRLKKQGYKEATIRNYIKAFSK